jgi:hypothetical protein
VEIVDEVAITPRTRSSTQRRKGLRSVTTKKGIARYVARPKSTRAKKPQSKKTPAASSRKPEDSTTASHPGELPIVLRIPSRSHEAGSRIVDIHMLPATVQNELKRRIDAYRAEFPRQATMIQRIINKPETYQGRSFCILYQTSKGMALHKKGQPTRAQSFALGGKLGYYADDRCIVKGVPCMHLIEHDDSYALCFVPLPTEVRKSGQWKDVRFWVKDDIDISRLR